MFYYAQNVLFLVIPRRNDEGSQCRSVIPKRNDAGSQCRSVIPRRNDEGSQCRSVIPRRNDEGSQCRAEIPAEARDDMSAKRSLASLRMTDSATEIPRKLGMTYRC